MLPQMGNVGLDTTLIRIRGNVKAKEFDMVWMRIIVAAAFVGILPAVSRVLAADNNSGWPPSLDRGNTYTKSLDGRSIERFTHQSLDKWGYKDGAAQLLLPGSSQGAAQRRSALRGSAFGQPNWPRLPRLLVLNRKVDPSDHPSDSGETVPADFFALFLDSNNNEAWGRRRLRQ